MGQATYGPEPTKEPTPAPVADPVKEEPAKEEPTKVEPSKEEDN